jgi:hypothetical protein
VSDTDALVERILTTYDVRHHLIIEQRRLNLDAPGPASQQPAL